jgi:hypothetical protein
LGGGGSHFNIIIRIHGSVNISIQWTIVAAAAVMTVIINISARIED